MYPGDGEGVECDAASPDDCGVPVNASLTLRFDRFLDPGTVNRQAIRVTTGDPALSPTIPYSVVYDPIERVVEFVVPPGYAYVPQTLYQIELVVPNGPSDFGIRAFDGAPLGAGGQPLRRSFFTSQLTTTIAPRPEPTCAEIVSGVLTNPGLGDCATADCHRSTPGTAGGAPEGLWLDSVAHLQRTAIDRVAHETEYGDTSGSPLENSPRFGVQMPIVGPKSPGGSYLLYKLLRRPENFEPCETYGLTGGVCDEPAARCTSSYATLPLLDGECLNPSAAESERLREWFVRGEGMPLQRNLRDPEVPRTVTLQGLRAVSAFIAAGADCSE